MQFFKLKGPSIYHFSFIILEVILAFLFQKMVGLQLSIRHENCVFYTPFMDNHYTVFYSDNFKNNNAWSL